MFALSWFGSRVFTHFSNFCMMTDTVCAVVIVDKIIVRARTAHTAQNNVFATICSRQATSSLPSITRCAPNLCECVFLLHLGLLGNARCPIWKYLKNGSTFFPQNRMFQCRTEDYCLYHEPFETTTKNLKWKKLSVAINV